MVHSDSSFCPLCTFSPRELYIHFGTQLRLEVLQLPLESVGLYLMLPAAFSGGWMCLESFPQDLLGSLWYVVLLLGFMGVVERPP